MNSDLRASGQQAVRCGAPFDPDYRSSPPRRSRGYAMSKHATNGLNVQRRMTSWQCRARRLALEREVLGRLLYDFLLQIPNTICFDFHDLHHLNDYKKLEPEGLVHAGIIGTNSRFTIIAGTSRIFKKPELRERLFALRRRAQLDYQKVVIATPKGLSNKTIRLRQRRGSDLVVAALVAGAGR